MSAGQAVLVVGVWLVIIAVVIAVMMIRLERVQRRLIQRGGDGTYRGDDISGGTDFYSGGCYVRLSGRPLWD